MPHTFEELAEMIARRDKITYNEAYLLVEECASDMEYAFANGSLDEAEDILRSTLGLELDYLDLFIY